MYLKVQIYNIIKGDSIALSVKVTERAIYYILNCSVMNCALYCYNMDSAIHVHPYIHRNITNMQSINRKSTE